jgi:glucan 1,3-beta-glucosidase
MTAERFNNTYQPYQTGGGDGQIAASALASVGQWPPPTMSAFPATLAWENAPVYTPTGTLSALPMPTITDAKGRTASLSASGWANTADAMTTQYVPVAGCSYPDPWTIGPTPTPVCAGGETGATLGAALATGSPVGSIVSLPAPTSTAARRR